MAEVQSIDPHSPTSLPDGRKLTYRQTAAGVDTTDPEVVVALEAGKLRVLVDDAFDTAKATIDRVLEWVGDDAGRARAALDNELARPYGEKRTSLIGKLKQLAGSTTDVEGAKQ